MIHLFLYALRNHIIASALLYFFNVVIYKVTLTLFAH